VNDTPKKNCQACKHCFMEPSDMNFTCGHPDSGTFGLYVTRGPVPHCGDYTKFEQHPMRNPDGSLKRGM
jgi:hypothetical protein